MPNRDSADRATPKRRVPGSILVLAAALLLAIAFRTFSSRTASHHPEPRNDASAATIMAADRYAATPEAARVYTLARAIPNVLDGLYCYCQCARNFGHRSLLTCFESDHGAECDICLREAELAWDLHQQGLSLDDIRDRIDGRFGG